MGKHPVEQLPAPPDERLPLEVLVFTGALADKHQLGGGVAGTEDDVAARLGEFAVAAGERGLAQLVKVLIHSGPSHAAEYAKCIYYSTD